MANNIIIKGAREHNLKDISLKIPKNKLVVLSGVSGSGKSSLAMDTLYAEGQRRYVESLSSYARQFLGMMKRPNVDVIEGLSPAIAIDQKGLSHNPRSTVGTVTEIYDYLRLLFARIGLPHCPECGREIARQTSVSLTQQIQEKIQQTINKGETARFLILSPVVRDRRGAFYKLFENLLKKGFDQVRIDGHIINLRDDITMIKTNRHNIDVVVDKLSLTNNKKVDEKIYKRILDDVEISLELSDGLVILAQVEDKGFAIPEKPQKLKDTVFSEKFACPDCNISLAEIEPRLFSFNSPQGACPKCNGIGQILRVDRSQVSPWRAKSLEKQYYSTTSDVIREEIERLMIKKDCPECQARRLKPAALAVTIEDKSIAQVSSLSLKELFSWTQTLTKTIKSEAEKQISTPIINEVLSRLKFLLAVGLNYLTLDRGASSLSVGEAQRIRLASQIGTGLTGVLYVLDEPTVGLHQRDTQRLIKTLKNLRDLGNTVVVVEHDPEVLAAADWILDFGPKAGQHGGQIVFSGPAGQIVKAKNSLTGQYLSGRRKIPPVETEPIKNQSYLIISGCREHNLKNLTIKIPLNQFVCVTGVSGSGKSSLVHDTLYPALRKELNPYFQGKIGDFDQLSGTVNLDQVLMVDQSPVGRTSRSNPATYIGVFTEIRKLMAQTKEARQRGFDKGHFSFNTKGGRCEACQGQGVKRVEMQFLADVWVDCEECQGKRFKKEVLEVEYKGKNIYEILELTIEEALEFFAVQPKIVKQLEILNQVGLNYLQLGQASPTLSGGESQRLKLARELIRSSRNHTIYLLDEPTTGLHFEDVKKLLKVINQLKAKGNSILVIEHNLDVIKNADWIIDLGPEGGQAGGKIVAEGKINEIKKNDKSWTGKYLKKSNV